MVEVLGMELDLIVDRASGSSAPSPAVPGRRRLAAIVRFHTCILSLRSPSRSHMRVATVEGPRSDGRLRALHSGHVSRHTRGHEGCVE
jgi:hypothetical protein